MRERTKENVKIVFAIVYSLYIMKNLLKMQLFLKYIYTYMRCVHVIYPLFIQAIEAFLFRQETYNRISIFQCVLCLQCNE